MNSLFVSPNFRFWEIGIPFMFFLCHPRLGLKCDNTKPTESRLNNQCFTFKLNFQRICFHHDPFLLLFDLCVSCEERKNHHEHYRNKLTIKLLLWNVITVAFTLSTCQFIRRWTDFFSWRSHSLVQINAIQSIYFDILPQTW